MSSKRGGNIEISSCGFWGLLTIAFIVLKLTKVIDWSWWWILAPLWIPLALAVVILVIYVVVLAVRYQKEHCERKHYKRRNG